MERRFKVFNFWKIFDPVVDQNFSIFFSFTVSEQLSLGNALVATEVNPHVEVI